MKVVGLRDLAENLSDVAGSVSFQTDRIQKAIARKGNEDLQDSRAQVGSMLSAVLENSIELPDPGKQPNQN